MRTYSIFKQTFGTEHYINKVSNFNYRQAISKLRVSSHDLSIETGRHGANKTPLHQRLCSMCHVIEDELHFLVSCRIYTDERNKLYESLEFDQSFIINTDPKTIFCRLMKLTEQHQLEKLGQFIYKSFDKRRKYLVDSSHS